MRIVICYVDIRNRWIPNTKTWVKIHRGSRSNLKTFAGLPVCLPDSIKRLCLRVRVGISMGSLSRGDLLLFKVLLTLISFFRAASPTYGVVKKSTIIGQFTGRYSTLREHQIVNALRSMGWNGKKGSLFSRKPSVLHFTLKSGPNAPIAVLGMGLDLIAWMLNPMKYRQYCLMC